MKIRTALDMHPLAPNGTLPPHSHSNNAVRVCLSMSLSLRYLVRLIWLTIGVALVTYGAIDWHYQDLSLRGFWLIDNDWRPHPVHLLVLGLTIIPFAMWDIFVLEALRGSRAARFAPPDEPPAASAPEAT